PLHFYSYAHPHDLHSFPTRRSSDLIDWDFGLTSRTREPKRALGIVRKAFEEVPFGYKEAWPKVSVVVCTFNGSRTIRECLEGIRSEEHTSELQSRENLVCRLLLEKK